MVFGNFILWILPFVFLVFKKDPSVFLNKKLKIKNCTGFAYAISFNSYFLIFNSKNTEGVKSIYCHWTNGS
jgi:hypothetical protein